MRVVVFSHTTGYQLRAFNDAAERLGIELVFATDRCHRLDDPWQDRAVAVRFHEQAASVNAVVRALRDRPARGVMAVGDRPVPLAARAAAALGLPWHPVPGAEASTDKRRSRAALADAGLPVPEFEVLSASAPGANDPAVGYPAVLKPVGLSGSRGVIRVNDRDDFRVALARIRALLARPQVRAARTGLEHDILAERYIDGDEFAVEGVLTRGRLQVFAIFDKPDPLTGPYFEETIYVTPSRLPPARAAALAAAVERGARALGLEHGPVHAEARITPAGEIYLLEIAGRPIGGLCSRVLTFGDGESLESVLLRHAVGEDVSTLAREAQGAAVMMVPIPRRGLYKGVRGVEDAGRVTGVTAIQMTAKPDQLLEMLPEAGSYLGFIFARGATAAEAERAVREAHARLVFEIAPAIAVSSQ